MAFSQRSVEYSRVATCATLDPDPDNWNDIDFLYPTSLMLEVAPGIDTAALEFNYGRFTQREGIAGTATTVSAGGDYPAKIPNREFVRIRNYDGDDTLLFTWYGRLGPNTKTPHGSLDPPVATGAQSLTADGLLRELDRVPITSSVLEQSPGVTTSIDTISRGLTFNRESYNRHVKSRGNRSLSAIDSTYIFSREPWGESVWTAQTAIEYLLKYHPPRDANGNPICTWRLVGGDAIDWYDIVQPTDRMTVKQVLDRLVDRRRMAGYFLRAGVDGDEFVCEIVCFSFAVADIALPGGRTVPANTDQTALVIDQAIDARVTITDDDSHVYDEIIGEGEPIRVTFTTHHREHPWRGSRLETDSGLVNSWDAALESEIPKGDSLNPGYNTLSSDAQVENNQRIRTSEKYRDVFALWQLGTDWDPRVGYTPLDTTPQYWVSPKTDSLGAIAVDDVTAAFLDTHPRPSFQWTDREFLPDLTRQVGATGVLQKPFVIVHVGTEFGSHEKYHYAHKLWNANWAADMDLEPVDSPGTEAGSGPGLRLRTQGGPQWFLDDQFDWDNAAITAPEEDPVQRFQETVNYREMWATLAIETDERIGYREVIRTPAAGIPARVLTIRLSDRRLDMTVPNTVTDIEGNGKVVLSEKGSIDRDDREEIETITKAAAGWYSRNRRAISASWKQINSQGASLGTLITSIGSLYAPDEPANAVVTNIAFTYPPVVIDGNTNDQQPGTTSIQTTFAQPDFSTFSDGANLLAAPPQALFTAPSAPPSWAEQNRIRNR